MFVLRRMQYLIAFQAQQSSVFYAEKTGVSFRFIANGGWNQNVETRCDFAVSCDMVRRALLLY